MVKRILCLWIVIFIFSISSCIGIQHSRRFIPLTLSRSENESEMLRLDGYYYYEYGEESNEGSSMDIFFLYENGIILYGLAPDSDEIERYEEMYESGEFHELFKDTRAFWGVYKIVGNHIFINRWVFPQGYVINSYIFSGDILDNKTFILTKAWKAEDGLSEKESFNWEYKFKEFPYKPKSENPFIE